MPPVFEIQEHTLECQHIREYARATANSQEEVLNLAIKQYIPLDNPNPKDGDITIIGAHANGFPKELYEPFWEDLHARSKTSNFKIRSIWIADISNQGQSGVLNEALLGDDPSWLDHSRDLLHLVNTFRHLMPRPIIGIGHSLGGNILVNLSLMHPRLLSTLILLDPVIDQHASTPTGPNPAQASTFRRDVWESRAEAEKAFKRSKFYQSWDGRVLERWCRFGIREIEGEEVKMTLTTTKHQECLTFLRPSWEGMSPDGKEILKKDLLPDIGIDMLDKFPFYRPEPPNTLKRLPDLRPSVLYVFGETSPMSDPEARKLKLETTGVGVGGSGGAKEGRVKDVVLKGIGHLVAMEASDQCANATAGWVGKEMGRFQAEKEAYVEWTKKSLAEKTTLSDEWKRRVKTLTVLPKGKL